MDTLAPPVVAVVVAHDPGPWFEETLASIASQDYAELSVLVLDSSSRDDLTARVAAVLPSAYVRRFEQNRGFGATVNEVRTMVDGADYFLLCHDDVALFPDTVHLMVEEAFRSNAGIVSPKMVSWDDPDRLVHVGMMVDKGGSVVDRVQVNEIDHGQHDAVRDVFVAPGGCSLIRADLFEELGGFDGAIVAMGEDLDLCWRAQVVGARIVVAPDARIRHLEELAAGYRSIEPSLMTAADTDTDTDAATATATATATGAAADSAATDPTPATGAAAGAAATDSAAKDRSEPRPPTLQELQRRHELLAVLKCYGRFHLLRVVPQIAFLAVCEVIVAELAGNRARARAVVRAWRWNLGRLDVIRAQRKELGGHRRLGDKEIRLLQVGGSARLSAYGRRVFQDGLHGAHADELAAVEEGTAIGGIAGARRALTDAPPTGTEGRLTGRTRLTVWLGAAVVLLIGSRSILTGQLPAVGQFAPLPSWTATWVQFGAGWHPSGVGTTAPASPALALIGLVGTVLFGGMGLTQIVLVFVCLPLGAWGMVRLLRPFGSQRASMVAGLAYLAMALPYNALALGRWGALVVYAGIPWVLARLFRATGAAPYAASPPRRPHRPSGPFRRPGFLRSALALGVIEAVMVSFVPAAALVVVLTGLALVASSCIYGEWAATGRALLLALASTVVAAFVCLPWLIGVLSAGRGAVAVFGVPIPVSEAASWGDLLRFADGPIGVSPLAWGFVVAGIVPLVLARGPRFRWAGRFWSVALVFWFVSWIIGRGWTGSLAVDPLVLLGPAAAAMAAAIGLGVTAFEEDLRAADFGWRQLVTVVATGAVALGAVPTLIAALPGRWDLPVNDFAQSVKWMHGKSASGAFRVLWLGDSRSLNQGSWSAGDGLAYATTEDGAPDARWLWNAPGPGPATELASAVNLARTDRTDQLGRMLAPAGVRYIVLLTSLAPEISGEQSPAEYPVPADLAPALGRQLDLSPVLSGTGITVFANADWVSERAELPAKSAQSAASATSAKLASATPSAVAIGTPGAGVIPGAVPVLPGPPAARAYRGPVSVGTVFAAVAPAGRWNLIGPSGADTTRSPSFGWAARYRSVVAGTSTLRFDGGLWAPGALLFSVVAWLGVVLLLLDPQLRRPRRRHRRVAVASSGPDAGADDSPVPVGTPAAAPAHAHATDPDAEAAER